MGTDSGWLLIGEGMVTPRCEFFPMRIRPGRDICLWRRVLCCAREERVLDLERDALCPMLGFPTSISLHREGSSAGVELESAYRNRSPLSNHVSMLLTELISEITLVQWEWRIKGYYTLKIINVDSKCRGE